jgi:hypothetical protein
MPPAKRKPAAPKSTVSDVVDEPVKNQEDPGTDSTKERPSTEESKPAEVAKMAKAQEVDEPVRNQENPGTSDKDRGTTNPEPEEPEYAKMAPAMEVDDVVKNQLNPGINMVDRQKPVIVTDSAGIKYDLSKSEPELVEEDRSAEKNAIRQQSGVLNAADWREDNPNVYELVFLQDGFTTSRVWKKGEVLRVEEGKEEDWMKLSAKEQKDLYNGRVMFEKR